MIDVSIVQGRRRYELSQTLLWRLIPGRLRQELRVGLKGLQNITGFCASRSRSERRRNCRNGRKKAYREAKQ